MVTGLCTTRPFESVRFPIYIYYITILYVLILEKDNIQDNMYSILKKAIQHIGYSKQFQMRMTGSMESFH